MTNVTVQAALKAALAAIDLYDYTMTVEESEKFAKAERLCKAALAEIDKCEPVAEVRWRNGEMFAKFKTDFVEAGTKLFTSPKPCDWVGLSDEDCQNIREEARDMLVDNDTLRIAEAKLKQLNTEG